MFYGFIDCVAMSSNKSEEHFDKTKEKVYQKVIQSREEDVIQTRLGYETIEKKFEDLEDKIAKLTQLKSKKNKMEKYILIFLGALVLFVLFLIQMIFFREREWSIFSRQPN